MEMFNQGDNGDVGGGRRERSTEPSLNNNPLLKPVNKDFEVALINILMGVMEINFIELKESGTTTNQETQIS